MKTFFQWLDTHPASYWIPAGLATIWMIVQVGSAVREKEQESAFKRNGKWDAPLLFLFIFAWRWPFLFSASEFNPDESQLIAGSMALSRDPVFWRSVDGTTSGPLNFYLLVPYSWLGIPLDYFTARLTGLLLIAGALFATHRALTGQFGRACAWLAILPATGFFATATNPDLIHYSSEHLALFLVAVAIWLLATCNAANRRRLWWASLVAGAAVWAKLQVAPLSVTIVIWSLWLAVSDSEIGGKNRWRQVICTGLAALFPTLLIAALALATGQIENLARRYLLQNLFYVGNAQPLREAVSGMSRMAAIDGRLHLLLLSAIVILSTSTIYFFIRRSRPAQFFFIGGLLTLAAFFAVLAPRRDFLHYTLLLPIPLTLWVGAALGSSWPKLARRSFGAIATSLLLLIVGLIPTITRAWQPLPEIFGRLAYHWSHPRTSAAIITRALGGPHNVIAIWGWATDVYVESGSSQATRDAHSTWSIIPNEQRDYYRQCYLNDLRDHQPPVFIDAIGAGAFSFENRSIQSHENFAELADYIHQNYTFVTDLGNARIYARNGLETLQGMTPSRLLALKIQGRMKEQQRLEITPTSLTRVDNLQHTRIDQQEVLMIPPPTQLEWPLEENVREVSFEFGFDPIAYTQGRSNGAGISLELANDYGSQTLFNRFLDPAQRPADRQSQKALVSLPSFTPGTRLVLRTDSGPYDDDAWDLMYLANLKFELGPPARP